MKRQTSRAAFGIWLGMTVSCILVALFDTECAKPGQFRENPLVPSHANFPKLFTSIAAEYENELLKTTETVPGWINGTWVKGGFCVFESSNYQIKMLFDAAGCGYSINIQDGKVSFSAKKIKSEYLKSFDESRYPLWRTFDDFEPARKGLDWLATIVSQDQADNYLVYMIGLGRSQAAALTDLSGGMNMDLLTMRTKSMLNWNDDIEKDSWSVISSAHPSRVASRPGILINFVLNMNIPQNILLYQRPFVYNVLEIDLNHQTRKVVAKVPTSRHHYVHENAITENYYVIIEFPFVWNLGRILKNVAIKNALSLDRTLGISFKVINLQKGTLECEIHLPTESFYAFHQINAFEENENIVMYMTTYDDIDYHLKHSFSLDGGHLNNTFDVPPATLKRVELDLLTGTASVTNLGTVDFELPVISDNFRGKSNRFVYAHSKSMSIRTGNCASGLNCGGTWWDTIVKVDLADGKQLASWRKDDFWPSEPVFVSHPHARAEDDGALLNVLLGDGPTSYLLILDAHDFQQLALIPFPISIPYQSHGNWISRDTNDKSANHEI